MKDATGRVRVGLLVAYGLVFLLATALGGLGYFHFGDPGSTCASCHEMGGVHAAWAGSAHRGVHCRSCHGGALTLDAHALQAHVNRVVQHVAGVDAASVRLAERDALRAHEACRECHPASFEEWQASRHAATFARIFLDRGHNRAQLLADDCLRCHGMFHPGSVAELVTPLDQSGPWTLKDPTKASQPVIPCLACHQIHGRGDGEAASLQFYDVGERRHVSAALLPVVRVTDAGHPVRVSSDPRQRLCVQCHAPSLTQAHRRGSGDDHTPSGVHEGLSCLDCHRAHRTTARASCQSCHPRESHCGREVETMDTSFASKASVHDIHTVACVDCHPAGRPAARNR